MTNPGQNTPWAGIPVPPTSKVPDVPVDLAASLDIVDTLLKNVIGGTTAPVGPLNPNVISVSSQVAGINTALTGLDTRLSVAEGKVANQGTRLTAVEGQAQYLYQDALVTVGWRPQQWTLWTTQTTDGEMHGFTTVDMPFRALMMATVNSSWEWKQSTTAHPIRTKLRVQVEGGSMGDRLRMFYSGNYQTHHGTHYEVIPQGKSVTFSHTVAAYPGGPANTRAECIESKPSITAIFVPYRGPDVQLVPVGPPS